VKWPVYALHSEEVRAEDKVFKLIRNWENKEMMQKDLHSSEYQNLMGAIKVLGEIQDSHIYQTVENTEILEEYGITT
jgi:hypothetical protein